MTPVKKMVLHKGLSPRNLKSMRAFADRMATGDLCSSLLHKSPGSTRAGSSSSMRDLKKPSVLPAGDENRRNCSDYFNRPYFTG